MKHEGFGLEIMTSRFQGSDNSIEFLIISGVVQP